MIKIIKNPKAEAEKVKPGDYLIYAYTKDENQNPKSEIYRFDKQDNFSNLNEFAEFVADKIRSCQPGEYRLVKWDGALDSKLIREVVLKY